MTNTIKTPLCATAAIAAALAFVPISAAAQEAAVAPIDAPIVAQPAPVQPTITLPETAAPVQPRPVIVLPQEMTASPAPVTEAPRAAAPETAAPVARTRPAPVIEQAAPAPARGTAAPVAVVRDSGSTTAEMIAENAPAAATTIAEPVQPVATAPSPAPMASAELGTEDSVDEALLAGLAGVLVVGAAGFLAMRSRRRTRDDLVDTRTPAIESVEPVPQPAAVYADAPVTSVPREAIASNVYEAAPVVAAPAVASRTHAPAASLNVADGPVATGAERLALLDRMVAAEPDEANPFTSHQARRRRARIILQHREAMARDAAGDGFDFRTYKPSGTRAATVDRERALV